MAVKIRIPDSVFAGWYKRFSWGAVGLLAHSLQGGQRWIFLLRVGDRRVGYRTYGDSDPSHATYHAGGWHFPWQERYVSGRG